jgi:hypothetical protein
MAAVARSDTAKTEGRSPVPIISRLVRKFDSPPTADQRARAILEVDVSFSEIIKFTNVVHDQTSIKDIDYRSKFCFAAILSTFFIDDLIIQTSPGVWFLTGVKRIFGGAT